MKEWNRNFYKTLFTITMPIALQNIISYSVNMMDTIMLGSLGEVALSASSLANQMFFIFTVVCYGIGGGAVVLTSQYWGKKDIDAIQTVTSIVLKLTCGISVIFTALIMLLPGQIMSIFTNEQAVIAAGTDYLRVVALSYVFYGITSIFLIVLRSVETVNVSVVIYAVSFCINVFFNWIFIFGKFGMPALGVTGAAVGTVLARIAEVIMMSIYVFKVDKKIRFKLSMLKKKSHELMMDVFRYGMPVMINELLWSVGTSMHAVILGHMGAVVVAANSICNVVFQMATSFIFGVSSASAVIIGKTVGSDDIDGAKKSAHKLVRVYFVMGILSAIVLLLIKSPVISIYKIEESTRALAEQFMILYSVVIFFMAYTCPLITGVFRGSGDTRFAMVVDVGCLWCMIPVGLIACFVLKLPAVFVLMCLRFDMPLKTVFSLKRLSTDKWIRSVTR